MPLHLANIVIDCLDAGKLAEFWAATINLLPNLATLSIFTID